jgi:hypothetical protein
MKSVVAMALAVVAGSAFSAGPVSVASATTTSTAPCTPSTSSIGGGAATHYCGPATAKLKVNGKTYAFKNGYCQSIPGFESDITLGLFAKGRGGSGTLNNAGKPYFKLDLGPGESSDLALTYSGGKLLPSEGAVSWKGTATSGGTFKSLSKVPASFSGSWSCHGVFVNAGS